MADTTLATNWVMESLQRIAREKERKALDDARAQSRAYNNLVESMQLILGVEFTERILSAHEPTSRPARIRSGRFEFEGRADACGTGFFITCPDYKGPYHSDSDIKSGWIDSIQDLDRSIDELTAEMQKRDEFVAARIEREAEDRRRPPQEVVLSPEDRLLVARLENLAEHIAGGAMLSSLEGASVHALRGLYSIQEMISQGGGDPSDFEPPDEYDPDRDR